MLYHLLLLHCWILHARACVKDKENRHYTTHTLPSFLLHGRRKGRLAILNGIATVTRPGDEFFQETRDVLDKRQASFKWL